MSKLSMHRLFALGTLGAALMLPSRLVAQTAAVDAAVTAEAAAPTATPVTSSLTNGPRIEQAGVTRASASTTPAVPQQYRGDRRDVAWMVVGGAALVVGSMVGGDAGTIIMITGGVVGLMGLFRYMQ